MRKFYDWTYCDRRGKLNFFETFVGKTLPFITIFPEKVKNVAIEKFANQMTIIVGVLIASLLIERAISKN